MVLAAKTARFARRGIALLVVLLLIIVLSVIVWSFQREVVRELAIANNVRDDLKASMLAEMGLIKGQVWLRLDERPEFDSLNEPWAQPVTWPGETFGADPLTDSGEGPGVTPPQLLISDAERKFNLLTMVRGENFAREKATEVFTRLVQICRREDDRLELDGEVRSVRRLGDDTVSTKTLVRNLIKYLEERPREESDEMEFSSGREKGDVRSMKKQSPYEMLTVLELLQVEGWSSELLFGPPRISTGEAEVDEDANRPWADLNVQERFELKRTTVEGVDTRSRDPNPIGLLPFVTLYSNGRININTAPREVLLALDERLTWAVVEQILTAREQDRQDIVTAEENGGELPMEDDPLPTEEGEPEEEEDQASFRAGDIANFQAFVARVAGEAEEGEEPAVEGLDAEIYAGFRPWLVVRSSVFVVEVAATSGKVTRTIRAVYRRTGRNAAGQPNAGQPDPATDPNAAEDDGLPKEPDILLTLLFKDVSMD